MQELGDWALGDALEAVGAHEMASLVAALAVERRVVVVCEATSVRAAVVLAALSLVGPKWPHLVLPLLRTAEGKDHQQSQSEMVLAPGKSGNLTTT